MFRVGNSSAAKDFLNNLVEDNNLKGMLYCAGYNLKDIKDTFKKRLDIELKTKENWYKRKVSSPINSLLINTIGANLLYSLR
jgi:hypothetical protein